MKNFIFGVIIVIIGILLTASILTINSRMTRDKENNDSLANAVETAVTNTIEHNNYSINNNEEFIADFLQHLLIQFENNSDIEVDVAGIDYKKGLLSIKVVEHFTHPNGKDSTIDYETTVILEKAAETVYYDIEFYDNDNELLKKYTLVEETKIPPIKIMDTKKSVKGWRDENGQVVNLNDVTVDRNRKFYAIY